MKHIIIFGVAMFCMAAFCKVSAQSPIDNKEAARVFVQKFYDWYGQVYGSKRHIDAQYILVKQKPQYLDKKLLNAIIADHRGSARHPKEIIGMDFDPFANSLDDRKGFQTGLVTQKVDKFFIDVHDIKNGRSRKAVLASKLVATVEVIKKEGQFVFKNILYPKTNEYNRGTNLLAVLDSLQKDRLKNGREN